MTLLVFMFTVCLFVVITNYTTNKRIDQYWKEWERNSFEHNGYRFNKDFYEIVDGELKEKK